MSINVLLLEKHIFVSIASEVIALAAAANFRLIENARSAAIQQEKATFYFKDSMFCFQNNNNVFYVILFINIYCTWNHNLFSTIK